MRAVGESHCEKPSTGRENRERAENGRLGLGDWDWGCAGGADLERVKGWGRMRIIWARMEAEPYCCRQLLDIPLVLYPWMTLKAPARKPLTASEVISSGGSISPLEWDLGMVVDCRYIQEML